VFVVAFDPVKAGLVSSLQERGTAVAWPVARPSSFADGRRARFISSQSSRFVRGAGGRQASSGAVAKSKENRS